jgi:hypothetical protein
MISNHRALLHSLSPRSLFLKPDSQLAQGRLSSLNSGAFRSSRSQNLGTLGGGDNERDSGNVGQNDPDLYKFKITKQRRVSLDVTNAELISSRYIRGSLLDDRQRSLKTTDKARAPFGSEDISLKLKSGTYFVKISTDGKKISYAFKLSID